jgi:ABC-2 type transport system permease protein
MGGAIFLWFLFTIIWQFIMAGILIASGLLANPESFDIPDWYYVIQFLNPMGVYGMIINLNITSVMSSSQDIGAMVGYPGFITNWLLIPLIIIWILVPLIIAFWQFKRKDI